MARTYASTNTHNTAPNISDTKAPEKNHTKEIRMKHRNKHKECGSVHTNICKHAVQHSGGPQEPREHGFAVYSTMHIRAARMLRECPTQNVMMFMHKTTYTRHDVQSGCSQTHTSWRYSTRSWQRAHIWHTYMTFTNAHVMTLPSNVMTTWHVMTSSYSKNFSWAQKFANIRRLDDQTSCRLMSWRHYFPGSTASQSWMTSSRNCWRTSILSNLSPLQALRSHLMCCASTQTVSSGHTRMCIWQARLKTIDTYARGTSRNWGLSSPGRTQNVLPTPSWFSLCSKPNFSSGRRRGRSCKSAHYFQVSPEHNQWQHFLLRWIFDCVCVCQWMWSAFTCHARSLQRTIAGRITTASGVFKRMSKKLARRPASAPGCTLSGTTILCSEGPATCRLWKQGKRTQRK